VLADDDLVRPSEISLNTVFSGVERVAGLVDVHELDGLADRPPRRPVGLVLAGDHAEQRRLAGAVGADDADDAALARQDELEVLEEQLVAEGLGDVLELDHLIAEALARRDRDLRCRRAWPSSPR
jgi:hypothetical protein